MSLLSANGLTGELFADAEMAEALSDRRWLAAMLDYEAALAWAEARAGVIPETAAEAIASSCKVEDFDIAEIGRRTTLAGNPAIPLVAMLTDRVREKDAAAAEFVHYGATSQDVIDTALGAIATRAEYLIQHRVAACSHAVAKLAIKHRRTVMPGRTLLQHALPISFGLKCALWLDELVSIHDILMLRHSDCLQFGGAVGTLASLGDKGPAVARELATELDLVLPAIPWHVARDGTAEAACWLGMLCGVLAKPATDVMLLMQSEVSEASEPAAPGRGGSSTMPQKRNPIACEYIIAQARAAQALVPQVLGAMAHDHERGAGPMQVEQLALGPIFLYAHGAMAQALLIAEGLVVDAARMRRNLNASGGLIVAEAVMMGLAPLLGRGVAHDVVHHACDAALAEGITLDVALAREARVTQHLDAAGIARLTDPAGYLGATQSFIDAVLARA